MNAAEAAPALGGWLSLPDAAKHLGITRQAAYARAIRGQFATLHKVGSTLVVSAEEIEQVVAADRTRRLISTHGLSLPQVTFLVNALNGKRDYSYSHFIKTARSLTRKGLLAPEGLALTKRGREVAKELAALPSAPTAEGEPPK